MAQLRRVNHVSGVAILKPWLQTFTLAVIILSLLRRPKSRTSRLADSLAASITLILHSLSKPLLASCTTISYTVWTSTPGTFASLNLPSHATFVRRLTLVPQDVEEDCSVCWSSSSPLAEVPCGHRYCIPCLQSLGSHLHTTCPQCLRPLFSTYDRTVFILNKASVCCAVVNTALFLIQATSEAHRSQWFSLVVSLGSISAMVWYLFRVRGLVRLYGENWWRGAPGTENRVVGNEAPKVAFAAFVSGFGILVQGFVAVDGMLS